MEYQTTSRLVTGKVLHRRHLPVQNRFIYPVFFLLLDIDRLEPLNSWLFGINRRRILSFSYSDYGDGSDPRDWVRKLLHRQGIHDCDGSIWLQTFPRVLGYLFNPVSFWYCTRAEGGIGAIVVEVNNTFEEKHCYVLQPDPVSGDFKSVEAGKELYVSPFYPVSGNYRFTFNCNRQSPSVRIDYFDNNKLQLNTAIWGKSRELSTASMLTALTRQPLLTLGVMLRIHWQALRLWIKRVPLVVHPSKAFKQVSK